jgi:predicted 2-oxoglutarate/Fe(II)-dependent dioxygenase YbiX
MEIKNRLENYVGVFDNTFPERVLNTFLKVIKDHKNFQRASIIDLNGNKVETKTRNAKVWTLASNLNSMTEVHWANFMHNKIWNYANEYCSRIEQNMDLIVKEINVLKYEVGGHYVAHTDHHKTEPRTLSFIFFLNDDYEGGDIHFFFPNEQNKMIIKKKAGRLIIFPSNFLYPHAVEPVTKGVRYTVVSWML